MKPARTIAVLEALIPEDSDLSVRLLYSWHWQVVRGTQVVIDVWPTKLKFRAHHKEPKAVRVNTWSQFENGIRDRIKELCRDQKKVAKKQQELPESRPRYSNVTLELDGEELRLCYNATGFVESIRLSAGDTQKFFSRVDALRGK